MNTERICHYIDRANDRGFFHWLPDRYCLHLLYWVRLKKRLNLKEPQTLNEKLQWMKLFDRKTVYTTMVDKYEAKKYIADKIGEEYVIPALGVWDNYDEIDFDSLPSQFVLKCTHDSGGLAIVRDKTQFNVADAREKFEKSLKTNYYYHGREWPYKNVKPRILAERYCEDGEYGELRDYKWYCFHGEPKLMAIFCGRSVGATTADFFDDDFNPVDLTWGYENAKTTPDKPKNFEKMKQFATVLSENVPFLRVDFYEVNGALYVGELTFFDGSGFDRIEPEEWDEEMGSWINLPTV